MIQKLLINSSIILRQIPTKMKTRIVHCLLCNFIIFTVLGISLIDRNKILVFEFEQTPNFLAPPTRRYCILNWNQHAALHTSKVSKQSYRGEKLKEQKQILQLLVFKVDLEWIKLALFLAHHWTPTQQARQIQLSAPTSTAGVKYLGFALTTVNFSSQRHILKWQFYNFKNGNR